MIYSSSGSISSLGFYLGLAKAAGGPVLDVACGAGRIVFVGDVKTMVRRRARAKEIHLGWTGLDQENAIQ